MFFQFFRNTAYKGKDQMLRYVKGVFQKPKKGTKEAKEYYEKMNFNTQAREKVKAMSKNIELNYKIADVQAVRVEIRNGLNPKRALYLRVKGKGDLPLSQVGQPIGLTELEDRAAEIAKFLAVPLEGL